MKGKTLRAVIDTNLFVSGLFAQKGNAYQRQQLWLAQAFELAVSDQILSEIKKLTNYTNLGPSPDPSKISYQSVFFIHFNVAIINQHSGLG